MSNLRDDLVGSQTLFACEVKVVTTNTFFIRLLRYQDPTITGFVCSRTLMRFSNFIVSVP